MPQTQVVPASNGTHLTPDPQAGLWHSGRRLAVIDIGSNGIRLLAVELIDAASWRSIAEERAMTRLAHGLAATRRLCPEAMASAVEAITRFKAIASSLGVHSVRAFATAAVREAENRDDFLSLVRDRAGLTVELVSARDEGSLTFRSAARVFDLSHGESTTVDIGGGSLEVVSSTDGVITANTSMPLGAVRLTEAFGGADLASGDNYKAMRRAIRRSIASHVPARRIPPAMVVGCGGTFTTLLTLAAASRGELIERNSPALLTLGPVTRTQLKAVIKNLRAVPLAQRLRVPGLPSDRADIIIAGLTVIDQLMRRLGATQLHVHPGGFREGLLLRMIEQAAPAAALPESARTDGVRALAQRCQADIAHASHVTGLALSLYDHFLAAGALVPRLGSDPDERALLHAAAMLHDVGIRVSYEKHHKHSMTIIRHALLPGFTEAQAELIAQIARYHRRAMPRPSHKCFARLAPPHQALVRRLAALLRVADGLDRQHAQRVTGVRLEVAPGRPWIVVEASGDVEPDLAAARKKADLLSKLLGHEVRIAPASTPAG